ncbi:MAG: hypothetical protein SGILL_008225 [Bacillariaceae sp.]
MWKLNARVLLVATGSFAVLPLLFSGHLSRFRQELTIQSKKDIMPQEHFPRVVHMDNNTTTLKRNPPAEYKGQYASQAPGNVDDDKTERKEECVYLEEWQAATTGKSTCNILHEVGLRMDGHMSPGARGSFKQVWMLNGTMVDDQDVVFKTDTRIENRTKIIDIYDETDFMDALVMEHTTFSHHIINLHGWCSYSSLAEKAEMGLVEWMNITIGDGSIKLNDFNMARFTQVNASTGEECPFYNKDECNDRLLI